MCSRTAGPFITCRSRKSSVLCSLRACLFLFKSVISLWVKLNECNSIPRWGITLLALTVTVQSMCHWEREKKRKQIFQKDMAVFHVQSWHHHSHYPACPITEQVTRPVDKGQKEGKQKMMRIMRNYWRGKNQREEEFSRGRCYRLPSTGAFQTLKGHLALGLTHSTL